MSAIFLGHSIAHVEVIVCDVQNHEKFCGDNVLISMLICKQEFAGKCALIVLLSVSGFADLGFYVQAHLFQKAHLVIKRIRRENLGFELSNQKTRESKSLDTRYLSVAY